MVLQICQRSSRVSISLDGHSPSKVYTSGSSLRGHVTIESKYETVVADLRLRFIGASETRILSGKGVDPAQHKFLDLTIPLDLDESDGRCLEPRRPCSVPFSFIIPHQLGSDSCPSSPRTMVHQQHIQLPPTLGCWTSDDQMPKGTRIEYLIEATVVMKGSAGASLKRSLPLFVIPFFPPQALIYTKSIHSRKKGIREHLFASKTGHLTATSLTQPPLQIDFETCQTTHNTVPVELGLSFQSLRCIDAPPDISVRKASLRIITYHSWSHINHLPDQERLSETNFKVLTYSTTRDLKVRTPAEPTWLRISDSPSGTAYQGILTILATLEPSSSKMILPTFHSCLIARTYEILLKLSVGSRGSAFTMTFPLQICSKDSESLLQRCLPDYDEQDSTSMDLPTYNET